MLQLLASKKKILFLIFVLALGVRLFRLGSFPMGAHVDEVKVGWNALSIMETGKDDRGNSLSLYYNSFGDFRPTGIFYLTIPSILLFGRNEFAIRFPTALFGALTIFPIFLLTYLFTKRIKIALFSSFFLAILPWHINLSRATSEGIISLFLALTGIALFTQGIEKSARKYLLAGTITILSSYFFYHSVRLLAPILLLTIAFFYLQSIRKNDFLKWTLISVFSLFLLTGIFLLNKDSRGRFSQVSIFNDLQVRYELDKSPFEEGPNKVFIARLFHNKPSVYIRRFINEYANYFSPNFLIGYEGKPFRYATSAVGILTYIEIVFFIAGLVLIAQKRTSVLPLLLLFIAPLPAALTTEDAPNLHRAIFMIPFVAIIEAYGWSLITSFKGVYRKLPYFLTFLLVANFIFYLHMYYSHTHFGKPVYRNIGAKELAIAIRNVQGNYDKIILTNIPDDPYPWIAFFTNRNPADFNKEAEKREKGNWSYENFVFTGLRCPSRDAFEKPDVKRLLVVDAEGCEFESNLKLRKDVKILSQIKRPDDAVVYTLWEKTE